MWYTHVDILFQKVIKNHFVLLFEILWREQVFTVCQGFSLNIKSKNPMQMYPHIIES